MRADRLLSILLLLQVHRRMTARELARRLEVSQRTIHRDMGALGMAGIPVTAERGVGGGWMLLEEYRTNLTGLNEAEIQALFLTKPPRVLADLGLQQASEAALIKLLAALPAMSRGGAEGVRQRVYVDVSGWRQQEEPVPLLPLLQEAIWRDRKLRLTYRGATAARLTDPLGLVAKGNAWYLVAAVGGQPRTYRVSRIQSAELLDEPSVRPADFELAAFWQRSQSEFAANLPRYPATLRCSAAARAKLGSAGIQLRALREEPPGADGWAQLEIEYETEQEASAHVLSFGDEMEVLAPEALRERVIRTAEGTLSRYSARVDETAARAHGHPGGDVTSA
jgi:predicted DNA-binding transcriptional regulator YafY